jgi:hypothetical protein
MGKNPNAKKLKEKKFKERKFEHDIEELVEEAARQGITLEELQEQRGLCKASDSSEDSDSQQAAKKKKKQVESSEEDYEEKKVAAPKGSDEDSDDAELEKLYGLSKNHKAQIVAQRSDSDSEEDDALARGKTGPAKKRAAPQ